MLGGKTKKTIIPWNFRTTNIFRTVNKNKFFRRNVLENKRVSWKCRLVNYTKLGNAPGHVIVNNDGEFIGPIWRRYRKTSNKTYEQRVYVDVDDSIGRDKTDKLIFTYIM